MKERRLLHCRPLCLPAPPGSSPGTITFTDEQYVVVAESNGALAPEAANLVDADTIGTDSRDLAALVNICTQTTSVTIPRKAERRKAPLITGIPLPLFILERRSAGRSQQANSRTTPAGPILGCADSTGLWPFCRALCTQQSHTRLHVTRDTGLLAKPVWHVSERSLPRTCALLCLSVPLW